MSSAIEDMTEKSIHKSVLLDETIDSLNLNVEKTLRVLDGTLGAGGHTEAILKFKNTRVLATDRDSSAIEKAKVKLNQFNDRLVLKKTNFSEFSSEIKKLNLEELAVMMWDESEPKLFDRVLLDLGISSDQLDDKQRGFSFRDSNTLDMRMDSGQSLDADEVLNNYHVSDLTKVFKKGGVGKLSSILAKEVVKKRPISSSSDFTKVCVEVYTRSGSKKSSHYATVPFQAVRIEVNKELDSIKTFLDSIFDFLSPGGILSVICFHSLEDKIVAGRMRKWARVSRQEFKLQVEAKGKVLTQKAIVASKKEIESNPRARSAMLRVFEKSKKVEVKGK